MMQPLLRRWLATTALGGVLAVGCNHAGRQTPAVNAFHPMTAPVTMLPSYTPPAPAVVTAAPAAPAPLAPAPVVSTAVAPAPAAVVPQQETAHLPPTVPAAPAVKEKETQPASYAVTVPAIKEEPVRRRSYADITASPNYAHATDYSWLQGELQLIHPSNVWRLRYASVEEEDRNGGAVTLIETGPMDRYTSGMQVRVEGQLTNTDLDVKERSPTYRVRSIHPLNTMFDR